MITADGSGSNGHRVRLWKTGLARLAAETGPTITVCHYPPGTSKWNRIEHRMFSFITMNWRGRPLTSYRTIIELIAATTTETGLTIRAERDTEWYQKGVKISDPCARQRPDATTSPHPQRPHRSTVTQQCNGVRLGRQRAKFRTALHAGPRPSQYWCPDRHVDGARSARTVRCYQLHSTDRNVGYGRPRKRA